jgi:exo-1,4-beta-D-glucosaminidase
MLPAALVALLATGAMAQGPQEIPTRYAAKALRQGWKVQSACLVQADDAQVSTLQYHPHGWTKATVPSTVLAAQVAAGTYKDPYYAMDLRKLPGAGYPLGAFFANLPMPQDSPYRCAWWYRKQFFVPSNAGRRMVWLHFAGINYRADLWVNGHWIADSKQIAGAYRVYDFNITHVVVPGKSAVVAIKVSAPGPTDLGINWVDWNPTPPDKDMGLWGAVELRTTGPVRLYSPFITTHFEDATLKTADITVAAELQNATSHSVKGDLAGVLAGVHFHQQVELAAGEEKSVQFLPSQFPQLKLKDPAIWWPAEMGAHPLETLTMRFTSNGSVSDVRTVRVGIRETASELTEKGARLFRINRRPLLVLGAGWSPDMLLREDHRRLLQQVQMVKDLHLNTIRLEGKLETEDFFRLMDENGILVMAGWCCCDQWEHWKDWSPENHAVALASLRAQMLRLRHHASMLVWLNGSDNPPPAEIEQAYLDVEKETQWPNPVLSSATAKVTSVTGPTGVKMTGPYDYVPPSYWLTDNKYGGAFGFNTETSPGPAIPQPDSLRRFLPGKDRWPINAVWDYHAGGGKFKDLDVFSNAMRATYGWPDTMEGFSRIAQTMSYDGERAMFEAYRRNQYTATGVVQWMLNNAWPSMIWHLYDYYLQTGGGYYGAKMACSPLHVQYFYDDHSIYVVSSLPVATPSLTMHAEVWDTKLHRIFDQTQKVDAAAGASQRIMDIPASVFQPEGQIYFVRLEIKNRTGNIVDRNFYWTTGERPQFDWAKTDYTHTPTKTLENMQALRTLPRGRIQGTLTATSRRLHVRLENPSHALAFQVQVNARTADGRPVLPLLWNDDFIELLPGEVRELTASLPMQYAGTAPVVEVSGWNVHPITLAVTNRPTVRKSKGK